MVQDNTAQNFDFVIEAEQVSTLKVNLVGEAYEIMPPKASITLKIAAKAGALDKQTGKGKKSVQGDDLMALGGMVEDWVNMTFSKDDAPKVQARLDDPSDLLDVEHILALIEKLVEKSSFARPTT